MTVFSDYFFAVGPSNNQASPNTLVGSGTTATLVSGYGGYTGKASDVIAINDLRTVQSFESFKIAAIATDWQSFFSSTITLLQSNIPELIGLTISGVSYTSSQVNPNYGVYTFSGSNGYSYIQTAIGGGNNLLTTSEALFVSGGWSGGNVVSGVNVSISGMTPVYVPLNSNQSFGASYGDYPFGVSSYDGSAIEGTTLKYYDFLVTASGNGEVTQTITYSSTLSGTVPVTYSQTTMVSGSEYLNFLTNQAVNTNEITVSLTASGQITYSQAGLFNGYTSSWVSPLSTNSMRISSVVRILLPSTNTGIYSLKLFSNDNTLLASNYFNNLPTQTWIDLTVDYILPQGTNNQSFYAVLEQSYSTEEYQINMFGIFYNPISYQFSIDGINWLPIIVGINDPYTTISLGQPTQNLYLKVTLLEDYTTVNAIQIVPRFTQNPFYNSTNINFLSDPKINEVQERIPTHLQPLFQPISLDYPFIYSQQSVMDIKYPFIL